MLVELCYCVVVSLERTLRSGHWPEQISEISETIFTPALKLCRIASLRLQSSVHCACWPATMVARPSLLLYPRGSPSRNLHRFWQPSSSRKCSDLAHIREEMISRNVNVLEDWLIPTPTKVLLSTLRPFLPPLPPRLSTAKTTLVTYGHHLVYFPPATDLANLLPDGTDALHSPGRPFTRRMWAGGSIDFRSSIPAEGQRYKCVERITDVQARGLEGEEKVFVDITRTIFPEFTAELKEKEEPSVVEVRKLVFMHPHSKSTGGASSRPEKKIKPPGKPDIVHTLVPTRELLFRFSALTLNAHLIHLDKHYCQDVEGHRNLLVHGPLSLVLMLEMLTLRLSNANKSREDGDEESPSIVEYKNIAPLYAEEEMKICVKKKDDARWEVWIEGSNGGLAVTASVRTRTTRKSWRDLQMVPNGAAALKSLMMSRRNAKTIGVRKRGYAKFKTTKVLDFSEVGGAEGDAFKKLQF